VKRTKARQRQGEERKARPGADASSIEPEDLGCRIGDLSFVVRVSGRPTRGVGERSWTDMHYLFSVIDDETSTEPSSETTAVDSVDNDSVPSALDVFNERLQADGYWVFAGGLGATDNATVIDSRGAVPVITDGPFVESKEHVGGLWIIEAADLDVALALAAEGSKSCNRKVEVRPFL
jgi:hypothetical protein